MVRIGVDGDLYQFGLGYKSSCQGMNATSYKVCILPKCKLWSLYSPWKGGKYRWLPPHIDIATYDNNRTHAWLLNPTPWVFPVDVFYPLQLRPLNGMWLPAPREPYAIFVSHYIKSMHKNPHMTCEIPTWDHFAEKGRNKSLLIYSSCKYAAKYYPFVHRNKDAG